MLSYLNTITGIKDDTGLTTYNGEIQGLNNITTINKLVFCTEKDLPIGGSASQDIDVVFYDEIDENDSPIPISGFTFKIGNTSASARGFKISILNTANYPVDETNNTHPVIGEIMLNTSSSDVTQNVHANYDIDFFEKFIAKYCLITFAGGNATSKIYIFYE